jgi:hypothetical protein
MTEKKLIKLGELAPGGGDLQLDLEALLDSRMIVQANSTGGKSWVLRLLAERASPHLPVILIDYEGEFASLREKVDLVLVGPQGEIAADVRSAGLLARKLIEMDVSAVIDIYELQLKERREFVKLFLESLMRLPKTLYKPTLIMIDEAHQLCPQSGKKDEYASTQAVIDLMSMGGKRGYCGVLATQRFSKLHNDALADANNVLIGRTWLDADQKRAAEYLGLTTKQERIDLREIGPGHFHCFGPALVPSAISFFKTDRVQTTHPRGRQRITYKPPKASDAIRQIAAQLEDLPRAAEEEARDLEGLRAQLKDARAELAARDRQLAARQTEAVKVETKTVEVSLVKPAELKRIEAAIKKMEILCAQAEKFAKGNAEIATTFANLRDALADEARQLTQALSLATQSPARPDQGGALQQTLDRSRAHLQRELGARPPRRPRTTTPADGDFRPSPSQQRVLDALAFYESIGEPSPSNLQVGAVALMDSTGGHFSNVCGPLSSAGLITRDGGRMSLTDPGRALSRVPDAVATLDDYHEMLRGRVRRVRHAGGKTVEMLNALIRAGGSAMTAQEMGEAVSIDHTGGHFSNTIGPLGTLGVVERRGGVIYPTRILFPPGLR